MRGARTGVTGEYGGRGGVPGRSLFWLSSRDGSITGDQTCLPRSQRESLEAAGSGYAQEAETAREDQRSKRSTCTELRLRQQQTTAGTRPAEPAGSDASSTSMCCRGRQVLSWRIQPVCRRRGGLTVTVAAMGAVGHVLLTHHDPDSAPSMHRHRA